MSGIPNDRHTKNTGHAFSHCRKEILSAVSRKRVVVICGETGSGKTTQVPQFIFEHWVREGMGSRCNIVITQPRRFAAVSVVKWVATERRDKVTEDFVEIPSDSDSFAGGDDFSDSDPEYEVNDKAVKTSKQRLEARKAISAVCESSDTESEQDDVPVMTAKAGMQAIEHAASLNTWRPPVTARQRRLRGNTAACPESTSCAAVPGVVKSKAVRTGQEVAYNVYAQVRKSDPQLSVRAACRKVSELTGVSERSVFRIKLDVNSGTLKSPKRKRLRLPAMDDRAKTGKTRLELHDSFSLAALRRKVHQYFLRNELPTAAKLAQDVTSATWVHASVNHVTILLKIALEFPKMRLAFPAAKREQTRADVDCETRTALVKSKPKHPSKRSDYLATPP
ncbi:hypothetical protein HPB51_029806 [Rhipicephalus microplus]|uniref:Uncharacterized protein n=1 Tax=Rhipicephalus microplus TaxID=6941 RepID=A0A9J6CT58_RHIMP|nr:hypothetical protein HPB51_029806 [Rhipicephalus microplus]